MSKKFHRYTITMTILTDKPINPSMDPDDIWREAMQGDYVGTWETNGDEIITPKDMASALMDAGSAASFFELNDDGSEWGEEDAI